MPVFIVMGLVAVVFLLMQIQKSQRLQKEKEAMLRMQLLKDEGEKRNGGIKMLLLGGGALLGIMAIISLASGGGGSGTVCRHATFPVVSDKAAAGWPRNGSSSFDRIFQGKNGLDMLGTADQAKSDILWITARSAYILEESKGGVRQYGFGIPQCLADQCYELIVTTAWPDGDSEDVTDARLQSRDSPCVPPHAAKPKAEEQRSANMLAEEQRAANMRSASEKTSARSWSWLWG